MLNRHDFLECIAKDRIDDFIWPDDPDALIFDTLDFLVHAETPEDYTIGLDGLMFLLESTYTSGVLAVNEEGLNILVYACMVTHHFGISWHSKLMGSNVYVHPTAALMCEILEFADEHGKMQALLAMRCHSGKTILDYAVELEAFYNLNFLYHVFGERLKDFVFPAHYYLSQKQHANLFNTIDLLKEMYRAGDRNELMYVFYMDMLNDLAKPLSIQSEVYYYHRAITDMFGDKEDYTPVERAIAELINILYNPYRVAPYLQYIDREFNRYYLEIHAQFFPTLASDQYDFMAIDNYTFPIPNERFRGIAKSSALQEFLMMFLRQSAGWAMSNQVTEWYGFIPREKANASLSASTGEFITEGRINQGLFHGKLTHMLHLALISAIIQDNQLGKVTLQEVVSTLVNHHMAKMDDVPLWGRVLDYANKKHIFFGNPFYLHSLVMRDGHRVLLVPSLADSMIDSFCKGFNKLARRMYPDNVAAKELYLADLRYTSLRLFKIPAELLRLYLSVKSQKVLERGELYALVKKPYTPNISFVVNPCRLFSLGIQSVRPQKRPIDDDAELPEPKEPRIEM